MPVDNKYEIKVRRFAIFAGFAVLIVPTVLLLNPNIFKKKT